MIPANKAAHTNPRLIGKSGGTSIKGFTMVSG